MTQDKDKSTPADEPIWRCAGCGRPAPTCVASCECATQCLYVREDRKVIALKREPASAEDKSTPRPWRIWFDTEFIEDGKTIDLISIGMVRDDGSVFYAECEECDLSRASPWVEKNVIPHLRGGAFRLPRHVIRKHIVDFAGETPEFWAYYAAYDWVALCQLFGTMMDLPNGWPMFCRDVKQMCVERGDPTLPWQAGQEHDAMADAQWTKEAWEYLSAVNSLDAMRKQLETLVQLHRDVESGADIPAWFYKEVCHVLGIQAYPSNFSPAPCVVVPVNSLDAHRKCVEALREIKLRTSPYRGGHQEWPLVAGIHDVADAALSALEQAQGNTDG